jgi:uncharacterized protein YcbX
MLLTDNVTVCELAAHAERTDRRFLATEMRMNHGTRRRHRRRLVTDGRGSPAPGRPCHRELVKIAALHTYPVKGCHRLDHDVARVEPWGLAGDRRWMVVDADGVGVTQREAAALVALRAEPRPGGLLLRAAGRSDLDVAEPESAAPVQVRVFGNRLPVAALPAGPAADAWLGRLLDRPVRLVWLRDPARHLAPGDRAHDTGERVSFADQYPLLLAGTASLDALNGWLAEAGEPPVPLTRFRPNLVVDGAPAWAEDDWAGRPLRIGDTLFRAAGPCDRCVVTTTDQETGVRGKEPPDARPTPQHRKALFGLHLVPVTTGSVARPGIPEWGPEVPDPGGALPERPARIDIVADTPAPRRAGVASDRVSRPFIWVEPHRDLVAVIAGATRSARRAPPVAEASVETVGQARPGR